ncbi:MAG: 6-phosphofructokinase [Bacteroidales bacterium]|nr:6-phosphofructokinase [Bacteroidales bacterium]
MKDSVAILCAGGPAPGINTVIGSVVKSFLNAGYEVLGIHEGYKTLFTDRPNVEQLDFIFADGIYSRGGSALKMSRYKPKDSEFRTDFFVQNNVKLLVTIGGDDTASTANRLSKFLASKKVSIANIHVPKTIDNDLPLPEGTPTFGYHSAKEEGVRIGTTIYEDARTSGTWFVISAMGREAGHLAFGIGTACHFPMIIIPEMFRHTKVTFEAIVKMIISSMVKRQMMGIEYGVAIVSEGVFHFMSDEEIESTGINFTYDEHGHPELGNVSKSHIFNMLVQRRLKELGISIKSRPEELGYELRCIRPIAYDLSYSTLLGTGVLKLFKEGKSGCMVTMTPEGNIVPLYLKDVEDKNGKIRPRLVNMDSERVRLVYENNLHYITQNDYKTAGKVLPDPAAYDFRKILGW